MTAVLDRPVTRIPGQMRAVATEGRRSAAPVLFLAVAVTGVILLFVHPDQWASRWAALAAFLRTELILLVPLCAAVATWQGGRERRRALDDVLHSTSRPGWHPLLATWAALTVAASVGLFVTFAVGSVFVLPYATYAGGGWWWLVVGELPALGSVVALGLAVGRWVPFRAVGLVVAVVLYVGQALPLYNNGPALWLDPVADFGSSGYRLPASTYGLQSLWFGGLTVVLLGLGALASVPVAVRAPTAALVLGVVMAVAGAAPLLAGGYERHVPDAVARRPVCAAGAPRVCVAAVDAYLLDDLTPPARRVLRRLLGISGAPVRAVGDDWTTRKPSRALLLNNLRPNLSGGLLHGTQQWGDPVADAVRQSLSAPACFGRETQPPGWATRWDVESVATGWVLRRTHDPFSPLAPQGVRALAEMTPAAQRAWIARVYATRDRCDLATETALLAEVGILTP